MRLNPFDTDRIRVRSTGSGGGGIGGRQIGCGGIVIVLIGALVFGIEPGQMLGTLEGTQQGQVQQGGTSAENEEALCTSNQYATETCNAMLSLNETWSQILSTQSAQFREPTLAFATTRSFSTGCGAGSVGMGPFYCPADETMYIDVNFYDQLARMSRTGGDFARYYVVAHEYAHHMQTVYGFSDQIRSAQQANPRAANQLSVRLELHADCYAGVWAGRNRNLIDAGDFEEGMNAAAAIGDDTLTGGRVSSESFTHGTSAQRMEALRLGMETGDDIACDNQYMRVS